MKILTKADFIELSRAGKLGNAFYQWATIEDLVDSKYRGWLTIRSYTKDSPFFTPVTHTKELKKLIPNLMRKGAKLSDLYFQEIPPPGTMRSVNAEAGFVVGGLAVKFTVGTDLNLRHALEQFGKEVTGVQAWQVLRNTLDEDSLEELLALWDEYPDAIIEFSEFESRVGVKRKRIVIWEVRDY